MLIKLSNSTYINPDHIRAITPRQQAEGYSPAWVIVFDSENRLVLSQAHFDELLSCLPEPVAASKEEETQPVWAKADPELLLALRKAGDEWRATHAKS